MKWILILAALASCLMARAAFAQDAEAELALAVAKLAANEASIYASPNDVEIIYQTARRNGRTAETQLAFLRRHSRCVLIDNPPTEARGNCAWSSRLTDSDEEPEYFPLTWSRHIHRWRRIREYAKRLVAGGAPAGGWACPEDPDTWGGSMDRAQALARGLVPLNCRAANEGYRRTR